MRRIAIFGVLAGAGALVVWVRGRELHERLMAHCEGMFERMPDTLPPKRMMRGIDEIRADTARILDLLETDAQAGDGVHAPGAASREEGHHVA